MSKPQKFLFDNFVIGEDNREVVEVPVADTAVFAVPENKNDEVEVELVEESPEPEVMTYSEDELAEKVKMAEERGYEQGFKAAQTDSEQIIQGILIDINNKLLSLITDASAAHQTSEKQFMQILKTVVARMIPTMAEENAVEIINSFIATNFKNFNDEPKLSFYLSPEVIKEVQEKIVQLANHNDFEGKIALHKDTSLGISDCRIEWENGGVERNLGNMLEKVDNLIEQNQPQG